MSEETAQVEPIDIPGYEYTSKFDMMPKLPARMLCVIDTEPDIINNLQRILLENISRGRHLDGGKVIHKRCNEGRRGKELLGCGGGGHIPKAGMVCPNLLVPRSRR